MRTRTENLTDVVAPKLTGPRTGRRFIRYWTKRFAGHAAAAGLPDRIVALRLGRAVDVRLDALLPASPGGDARASGTAVRSLCWPRWAATGELRRDGAGSLGDGERRAECPLGNGGLVLSRMLYGLTVSGLVPAAQTWAIQRAGWIKDGGAGDDKLWPELRASAGTASCRADARRQPGRTALADGAGAVDRAAAGAARSRRSPLPPVAHQSTRLQASMLPFRCWRCCWQRWSA